jgi:protoporphyrinogen oxidase
VLLPASEGFTASWVCTSASKADEHAPDGCSVLTAVFCGAGAEGLAGEPDDVVLDVAAADLERCFRTGGIRPVASRVYRHEAGRPVPGPGYGALAGAARLEGSGTVRLALAGDWTTAPTVEGAVSSGEWAAGSVLAECGREQ